MSGARWFDTDEIVPSGRERKSDRLKKIIKRKQANTARWANRYYAIRKNTAKRIEAVKEKYERKLALQQEKFKERLNKRVKSLELEKFDLHSKVRKLRVRNAKMAVKAMNYDKMERFFTQPLQRMNSRVITSELFIRYVFTLEEMFNKGEIDRMDLLLLLTAMQSEYITRIDLVTRYGRNTANKMIRSANKLAEAGMIVKFKGSPLRYAITDIGRKELTSIVYKTKNRNMPNYK